MTKIEEAAENHVNQFTFGIAHPRRVCKTAFIKGATHVQETELKEARELIEEMKKQLIFLTNSYRLLSEDEFDNNNLITKAEIFLNK